MTASLLNQHAHARARTSYWCGGPGLDFKRAGLEALPGAGGAPGGKVGQGGAVENLEAHTFVAQRRQHGVELGVLGKALQVVIQAILSRMPLWV